MTAEWEMAPRSKWRTLDTDAEFAALFAGARIVQATTSLPEGVPHQYADIFWELSDGSWLGMEVSTSGGCPTCGYGAGDKTYYHLPAREAKP